MPHIEKSSRRSFVGKLGASLWERSVYTPQVPGRLAMSNSGSERRGAPRFAVIMEAQATDLRTNTTFKLRCSDISLTGCYLDTLNPAEAGVPVRIRLEHGRRVFECQAKVAYKLPQMGMGVAFTHPLPGEQLETVSAWVSEAAAVTGSQG